jgi:hypothetical protein
MILVEEEYTVENAKYTTVPPFGLPFDLVFLVYSESTYPVGTSIEFSVLLASHCDFTLPNSFFFRSLS